MKKTKLKILLALALILIIVVPLSIWQIIKLSNYKADQASPNSKYNWYSQGAGMGGRIPKVTIDQTSSNIIYLGADVAGNFKSTDGGESWQVINEGLDSYDTSGVTIDADNHEVLYTSATSGVFKSLDGGLHWTKKGSEPKVSKYAGNSDGGSVGIVQAKNNKNILYAISWADQVQDITKSFNFSIYKSVDRGETWSEKNGSGENTMPANSEFMAITVDPTNDNLVYVGTERGLYQTNDGGNNWNIVSSLNDKIHTLLGYDASNQLTDTSIIQYICNADVNGPTNIQYKGTVAQCLIDYEIGPANHSYPGARQINSIEINPYNTNQIFVLSRWGHIFRTEDKGQSWREIYHRDNPTLPDDPGHFDVSKNYDRYDHDWMSFDSEGYTNNKWAGTSRYAIGFVTIKLDVNPNQSNISACGTDLSACDYNLYVNIRYGETRGRSMWRINKSNIELDGYTGPSTACLQYYADGKTCKVYQQLLRDNEKWEVLQDDDDVGGNVAPIDSEWYGHNWNIGLVGVDMFDLDLSTPYPNRTVIASGMTMGVQKGIPSDRFKTPRTCEQGGVTDCYFDYEWQIKWKGLENYVVTDVLYDPVEPRYVYAAVMDNGFFFSSDGGKNFQRSLKNIFIGEDEYKTWCTSDDESCFGGHGMAMAASVVNGKSVLYLALSKWGNRGSMLFKSLDHGTSWENISGQLGKSNALPPSLPGGEFQGVKNMKVDPGDPNRIFLSYNIFYSSQQDCVKAVSTCKSSTDCMLNLDSKGKQEGNYTAADLDTWQTQTCGTADQYANPDSIVGNDRLKKNLKLWKEGKAINVTSPIWVTEDGGATWKPVGENGLTDSTWGYVDFDPETNDLFLGAFDYACIDGQNCHYGIYKTHVGTVNGSLDWANVSWEELTSARDTGVMSRIVDLEINPFNHNEIFALTHPFTTPAEVYLIKSTDGGQTWTKDNNFMYSSRDPYDHLGRITFDPYRQGRVAINISSYYNIGNTGLMISDDGGATWKNESLNMSCKNTSATAFHPFNQDKILVGTNGVGLTWSYDVRNYQVPIPTISNQRNFTFKSTFTVNGSIPSEVKKLILNGSEQAVSPGNFSTSVNLPLGKTSLNVVAEDEDALDSAPITWSITRYKPGDSNGDGNIDVKDFSMLMANWDQSASLSKTDYNEDGSTNIKDFAMLLSNWKK